jgi:uncharacterized protein
MRGSCFSADAGETPFSPCSEGVRVRIRVAPKASRNAIQGTCREAGGGIALKVSLTAAAEGGKANAELIRMLASEWRVPQSQIAITAGQRDRRKTLRIAGDPENLLSRLARWCPMAT